MAEGKKENRVKASERIALLEAELATTTRQRHARRLAPQLVWAMGIASGGVNLIHWLGEGSKNCRTNLEAVQAWIEVQLADPEFSESALHTPEFNLLEQRLNRRLATIEGSYAC